MILYISYPTIINTKHQKLDNLKKIIYNLNTVNTDGNFLYEKYVYVLLALKVIEMELSHEERWYRVMMPFCSWAFIFLRRIYETS